MSRLSIVTVVRNDLPGLLATRASLRAQRFTGWEWIVVDGASEDGTAAWLAAHAAEPAWWRSSPDGGLYDAMNAGLDAARGGHVLFLNAGDILAGPAVLGGLAAAADRHDADLLYGDALERAADGTLRRKPARSHRFALYGMFTHHQAMAYRRALVADLRFESRYPVGADYAFTLHTLKRAERVARLDFPVCVFAPDGVSQRTPAVGRSDQTRVRQEVLGTGRLLCAAITATQCCAAAMKQHLPALYLWARFRTKTYRFNY